MASHPTNVPAAYDGVEPEFIDETAIFRPPVEWQKPELGLRKHLLLFSWVSIDHPTELSECLVRFDDIEGLGGRESNYLCDEGARVIQLGSAVTDVDFLVDIVFQHMYTGETSRVYINTKNGDTIVFTATLLAIQTARHLYQLSAKEMLQWALAQKNQGVAMFKKWPSIAQRYFNLAAKGLISFKPFDAIDPAVEGISGAQLQTLHDNVCLNISACLLKESRFDDVIHVLGDLTQIPEAGSDKSARMMPEKAVYRKALAHVQLSQLDEARELVECVDYAENPDLFNLWTVIVRKQSEYNEHYAQMVRKMFG